MGSTSTLAIFVLLSVDNTFTLTQDQQSPAQAIGKRVEIKVNHRHGEGRSTFVGMITQVDEKRLILEDVSKMRFVDTGVPFLSNLPKSDKLFKNVRADKTIKLEYGIVLQLDQIHSWRVVKSKNR